MSNKVSIELSDQTIQGFFNLIRGPSTSERIAEDISERSFDLLECLVAEKLSKDREDRKETHKTKEKIKMEKDNYFRKRRRTNSSNLSYHPYSEINQCDKKEPCFAFKKFFDQNPPPVPKRPDTFTRLPSPTFGHCNKCLIPCSTTNESKSVPPPQPDRSVPPPQTNKSFPSTQTDRSVPPPSPIIDQSMYNLLYELLRELIMDYSSFCVALMNKDLVKLDYFMAKYIRKFSHIFNLNHLYKSVLISYSKIVLKSFFEKYEGTNFFLETPKNTSSDQKKTSFDQEPPKNTLSDLETSENTSSVQETSENSPFNQETSENSFFDRETPENTSSDQETSENSINNQEPKTQKLQVGNLLDLFFKNDKEITDMLNIVFEETNDKKEEISQEEISQEDLTDMLNNFFKETNGKKEEISQEKTSFKPSPLPSSDNNINEPIYTDIFGNSENYLKSLDSLLCLIPDPKLRDDFRKISKINEMSPENVDFNTIKNVMESVGVTQNMVVNLLESDMVVNLLQNLSTASNQHVKINPMTDSNNKNSLKSLTEAVGKLAKIENINNDDNDRVGPLE